MVLITTEVPELALAFMVVFVPFFLLVGMKGFAEWVVSFIKVRQGYFSVNWIMKNHQWKERMLKPKGNEVEVENKPQPFINNPSYTAFRGSKKVIFFSRIGDRLRQLQIKADTDKLDKDKGIPPETEFNDMLDGAEMAGSIFGIKKSQFERMLLIIAVVAAGGALLLGVINLNMANQLDIKLNQTQGMIPTVDAIAAKVIDKISPYFTTTTTIIPTNAAIISG